LSLKMALRNAYDRAFTAILDSNVTTAITSAFLVYFGSEEVKGFGLTLLIGILTSMFTALYLTGAIFDLLMEKFGLRKLGSFPLYNPWWNRLLVPKVAWMNHWKKFLAFSVVFGGLGIFAFVQNAMNGRLLDVEFAGGTEVQFATKSPMTDGEVNDRIKKVEKDVPQPTVTAMGRTEGGKYREFSVTTANQDRNQVATALFKVLEDQLTIAVPSTFVVGGQTSELRNRLSVETAQQAGVVVPVTTKDGRFTALSREVPGAAAYSNGVAVIMDKITPPLAPEEIRQRIGRALSEANDSNLTQFDVVRLDGQTGDDRPTDRAVAMLVSRNFPYDKNAAEWVEKVAGPFWRATTAGVGREASFQKVTNVDAQVAGATQQAAIFATLGSLVGVMIWIWLRFGDVKYGTATVAAMLHDTMLVVGAVGLSHWVGSTFVGDILGVEGFRVNLTLVAAILTVMGYSMVDTIVVFDRIRENRGKYGVISKKLIDDSVNQTLSRTLLTVATTCATLMVMYIWGGAAIHGFAFILLVGILIGTYSSIAIAAPILLIGHDQPKVKVVTATRASEAPKKSERVNA
ncbi:MAG: protein translocase subunit SecF, partial [Phycisphaerae bacterium]